MATLNVGDLTAGMKTSAPVSVQGRMLVGEDVEISDKLISMFKTWGVARVDVQDDGAAAAADPLSSLSDEDSLRIKETISLRFSRIASIQNNALMSEIARIALKFESGRAGAVASEQETKKG